MEVIPFDLETATRNAVGSPDISASILRKIDESDLFLADVSIINSTSDSPRKAPNPNVLYELGYALKSRGEANLILIANKDITKDSELPFDIRNRRIVLVSFSDKGAKKMIMKAIGAAVTSYAPSSASAGSPVVTMTYPIVDWASWTIDGQMRAGFRVWLSVDNFQGGSDYITSVRLVLVLTDGTEKTYGQFYIKGSKASHPFAIAPNEMLKLAVVLQERVVTGRFEMPTLDIERAYVEVKIRSGKVETFDIEPSNIIRKRR